MSLRTQSTVLLALLASACATPLEVLDGSVATEQLVEAVAHAHGVARLRAHDALSCRVHYAFADVEYSGRLWVDGGSRRARLELDGGGLLIDDGESVWCEPAQLALPNPSFHAELAARLLRLPAELADEETPVKRGEPVLVRGQELATLRVRWEEGRDPLADELVVHVDPRSARILLVGLSARLKDGGIASSAALPEDWVELDGYLVPTTWKGHRWSPAVGLVEGPLAVLALDELKFVRARPGTFVPPRSARRLPPR